MPKEFKPQTWRDVLLKNKQESKVNLKHNWIICGGGGSSGARSFTGIEKPDTPRHLKYKCIKCGATGSKYVGEEFQLDDKYSGLSCDAVIIKDIIE